MVIQKSRGDERIRKRPTENINNGKRIQYQRRFLVPVLVKSLPHSCAMHMLLPPFKLCSCRLYFSPISFNSALKCSVVGTEVETGGKGEMKAFISSVSGAGGQGVR